jgi:hypothetical protein
MFAINHASTALILKRRFPAAPMIWLLLSVQLMELLWVLFNYVGLEKMTTEVSVKSVSDIHLAFMPYSHSIASAFALGIAVLLISAKGFRNRSIGLALGAGVLSHLILDLITHAPDISIAPGMNQPKFGLGLYGAFPLAAFVIEILYGVFCWWVYGGGKGLLAVIVLFNLANLSLLSPAVPGPEQFLAGRPLLVVTVIAVQVAVTLTLVGVFSTRAARSRVGTPEK